MTRLMYCVLPNLLRPVALLNFELWTLNRVLEEALTRRALSRLLKLGFILERILHQCAAQVFFFQARPWLEIARFVHEGTVLLVGLHSGWHEGYRR
jgi:hypothetical protein